VWTVSRVNLHSQADGLAKNSPRENLSLFGFVFPSRRAFFVLLAVKLKLEILFPSLARAPLSHSPYPTQGFRRHPRLAIHAQSAVDAHRWDAGVTEAVPRERRSTTLAERPAVKGD